MDKSLGDQFLSGEIDYDTYCLGASPSTTSDDGPSTSTSSWTESSTDSSSDEEIPTAPKKQAYVNEMTVGQPGKKSSLWEFAREKLSLPHRNVSVESPSSTVTSGMDSRNGDVRPFSDTKSVEQTERNRQEGASLKKIPVEEYDGGAYKDVDVDKLEQNLHAQIDSGESTGIYGLPTLEHDGSFAINTCHTHARNNLFDALPEEQQQERIEANRKRLTEKDPSLPDWL